MEAHFWMRILRQPQPFAPNKGRRQAQQTFGQPSLAAYACSLFLSRQPNSSLLDFVQGPSSQSVPSTAFTFKMEYDPMIMDTEATGPSVKITEVIP